MPTSTYPLPVPTTSTTGAWTSLGNIAATITLLGEVTDAWTLLGNIGAAQTLTG